MNALDEVLWDGIDADDKPTEAPAPLTKQSAAAWHFTRLAGDRVRYDHGRRRWLTWAGNRWLPDKDAAVDRLYQEVQVSRYRAALALPESERVRVIAEIQAAGALDQSIIHVLNRASKSKPIATTADAWDRDAYLLGCENGVIDLRTGELRPGRPEDMISRSTGVEYDPEAQWPRWHQFLMEVFADDTELVAWFALSIGSALVGQSTEIMPVWYGGGNNGKSVGRKTLTRVFGDYAVGIAIETLTNSKRQAGGATPDLMPLRGARLAFASEPDKSARLKGGTLKRLVNVDAMNGRGLYGEQETWPQTHDLVLCTNHKPETDDLTDSFWRRLALVPFGVHFAKPGEDGPPEDGGLEGTLATEVPGILNWAVRAAVAFVADPSSLKRFPVAVRSETAALRAEQDPLSGFVESRVEFERTATVTLNELYAAYLDWAAAEGVPEMERLRTRAFKTAFEDRDQRVKYKSGSDRNQTRHFVGARICGTCGSQEAFCKSPHGEALVRNSVLRPSKSAKSAETPADGEDDYPPSAWDVAP
jgi:putative DNA primase/helicase